MQGVKELARCLAPLVKELCLECEKWAKGKGCSEFASDCELTNNESLSFHLNIGFIVENKIICFE